MDGQGRRGEEALKKGRRRVTQSQFRHSEGDKYIGSLDLDGMKYNELQKECIARGLSGKGRKEELKTRLGGHSKRGDDKPLLQVTSCPEALLHSCAVEEKPCVLAHPQSTSSVRAFKGNKQGSAQVNSGIHTKANAKSHAATDGCNKVNEHPTAAADRLAGHVSSSDSLQPFRDRVAALKQRRPAREPELPIQRKQGVSYLLKGHPHNRRVPHRMWTAWASLLVVVFVLIIAGPALSPISQQCLSQARTMGAKRLLNCIRLQLQRAVHGLRTRNRSALHCGMDALFRSSAVRNLVPHRYHDMLDDAEELAVKTGRAKGVGVFLMCDTEDTCSEGVEAMRNTATAASQECWDCFKSMQASRMEEGTDLAGELQLQLTTLLKKCPTAVYVVEEASQLPYSAVKVLVNALSEHGHFQDSGAEVPSNKATYVFTAFGNVTDDAMTPEQFTKSTMDWLSARWMSKKVTRGEHNVQKETAMALRRRIDFSLPMRTLQRQSDVETEV